MSGLNSRAGALVDALIADSARFRVAPATGPLGETLIDCGAKVLGGIEAGLRLAEIAMGGLGRVTLSASDALPRWPFALTVRASDPVAACLASQYAGWNLSHGEGKDAYFALGSGPARALAGTEAIFEEIGRRESAERAVLVLETDRPPPSPLVEKIARDCGVAPERLAILYAPTRSLAGSVQVVARVLEVALHKVHALHFPLERVVDGMGAAPLSPPHPKFVAAMGRTNDAIIYGGRVQLFVTGPADEAKTLAEALPSRTSHDYGAPFAETFKKYNNDFYKIDPMLFSPAEAIVTALDGGETFRAGSLAPDLVDASFGG